MSIYITKVVIEKESTGNQIKVTYRTVLDTTTYLFDIKDKKKSQMISPYYGSPIFNLVKEYSIKSENKIYKIYHFSTYDGTMDAGSEHYWNEELGVFFTRAKSWPTYRVLQSTDENKNEIIWRIIKEIFPTIIEPLNYMDFLVKEERIKITEIK